MKETERIAKLVVEAIIPGAQMLFCEDQSDQRHDFDLVLPGGEMAALEVTTFTDQALMSIVAAIEKHGFFVAATKCKKHWIVHPLPNAVIKEIHSHVDESLAKVEAVGVERFIGPMDCSYCPAVNRIYRCLGIEAGAVTSWKKSGQIGVCLPQGGEYTGQHVQSAVRREASKADNRKKLGKSGCRERHLFVYVDLRTYPTWKSLLDEHPPVEPPKPPDEISHVWIASDARIPDHFVVWRGSADRGWSKPELLPVQIPST